MYRIVSSPSESTNGRGNDLWPALDSLLAAASPERARAHGLGPLEALRLNRVGAPVPDAVAVEARIAAVGMLSVRPLLERVRDGCEGPLVLMKGPEVAMRYPGAARGFMDVDLLTPDPHRAHHQLQEAGFVEAVDPELFDPHHHLLPLKWPNLPLTVEMHGSPHWPEGLQAPSGRAIIGGAVPSALGIDGIHAPQVAQHALLIAAHAWAHEPLRYLRDLIDVRAIATPDERAAIERTANAWGITRLWRTTDRVTDAVLGRRRMPIVARSWARHLPELRERTVLENHLCAWLAAYSALPAGTALARTASALRSDILPAPEEGWSDKLTRTLEAARSATSPLSHHHERLGEAATRGRKRKRPNRDAVASNDDPS